MVMHVQDRGADKPAPLVVTGLKGSGGTTPLDVAIPDAYAGPEGEVANGQTIAYTGTAGTSAAITGTLVDVVCTSDAFIAIATNPTATTDGYYVTADVHFRFPITSGAKVSAIQDSAGGNLHVHPVS